MSPAARLCLRAELRTRHRSWLVLALLIGIAGGVVLATAAGARRTESALARHVTAYELADVVTMRGFYIDGERDARPRAGRAPTSGRRGVAVGAPGSHFPVTLRQARRPRRQCRRRNRRVARSARRREVDRTRLLRGRAPRPDRPDEALVNTTAFTRLGYEIGDTVQVRLVSHAALWGRPSAADRLIEDPAKARTGPLVRVRIVGVVAAVEEGVPGYRDARPCVLPRARRSPAGSSLRGRQCSSPARFRGRPGLRTRLPTACRP